jgi:YebC/PmpR family DNA-binding regulatory protein
MAGHNKWSKVKRLKGALDQKRGKLFSKLAKEITLAAKMGGGDPGVNARLRSAILSARGQSMPGDNIERAIQRGQAKDREPQATRWFMKDTPRVEWQSAEVATDSKNRTAADLRLIFQKTTGILRRASVAYLFKRKGQITIPYASADEDKVLEVALESGAEDVSSDSEHRVVTTAHDRLYAVAEALLSAGVVTDSQKLTYMPESTLPIVDAETAAQVIRLCEALEESDDVQNVHANFDVAEEMLAKLSN